MDVGEGLLSNICHLYLFLRVHTMDPCHGSIILPLKPFLRSLQIALLLVYNSETKQISEENILTIMYY